MSRIITNSEAKQLALAVITGVKLGDWNSEGLTLTKGAAEAIRQIGLSKIAEPIPGGRRSAGGNAFDLFAPSPWHALGALLLQETLSRVKRGSLANGLKNIDQTFGGRPFYRGQPRAWDIQPTAWRTADSAYSVEQWIEAFAGALREHLYRTPDPVMSLVQRDLDSTDCFLGLAQHYGLPTSLVDFTLSPLVAMGFACSNTRAPPVQPRDLTDPMLRDCAVVYIVAAPAFATATGATFEFPPSYSIRLYRQRGLFANFGAHPAGKRLPEDFPENYGAPWCWLQQNAQRVFFPRKYPELEGADELRDHELMKGDEFIIEVVNLIRSGAPHSPDAIHLSPPWVCDSTEKLGEANARFCNAIDSYLRSACLIKMEQDGDIFDPSMLKFLERWIAPELEYFLNMAAFAQEAGMPHPGLSWTADRVRQARACIS